jgi:hypothetical protein
MLRFLDTSDHLENEGVGMAGRPFLSSATGSLAALLVLVVPAASEAAHQSTYPVQLSGQLSGNLPPATHPSGPPYQKPIFHWPAGPHPGKAADPVVQTATPIRAAAQSLGQWEGLGEGYPGFTVSAVPPDTNMAVGPNHIVQWVNNAFVVFDKQGNQLQTPVDDGTFWGINSTCYQGGGFSDPVIQYDRAADRWIVAEVAIPLLPGFFGQYAQCFAVSKTSDPSFVSDVNGNNTSYTIWAYGFGSNVNDYDKIAVWPDGYYVTWNIFQNGTTFIGPEACAWNRNDMIQGVAAPRFVCFQLSTAHASLLASDLDGATAPPTGSPNYLMEIDPTSSALNLFQFHVDFTTPANSTFTGPFSVFGVAPFTPPCPTTQDCIPQPGTTQLLDALGDRLMYRLAYHNYGDHESIVANHTVLTAGGNTGVRWYEVRNPATAPAVYQQGTFAPDTDNRWMASIAMDRSGNIGLGYSVASAATYPSIRYTGWEVGNTLNTLQAETSLVAGGGSQTGYNRWGDYSAMRIDPSDDCTFWYTQEYQAVNQAGNWNTRIGSFKFSSCGQALVSSATTVGSSLNPSTYGQSVTFTATVTPSSGTGTPTGSVSFKDAGTTLGSSALNASGVATFSTSSLAGGAHSITGVYSGDATFSGSTSAALAQTVNPASTTTTLTSSLNPSTFGTSVKFTATVSPATAIGTVQFFDGTTSLGSAFLSAGAASLSTATLSAGVHSITANYAGNANFLSSVSGAVSQTVNPANTTTTLSSSANPSALGQNVTFTAKVSPAAATGTVTFSDGSNPLGSASLSGGTASLSTSALAAGAHSITATYSGDANDSASTSLILTQTVNNLIATSTSLTSSPNPSVRGQNVTFTAAVVPSSGTGTPTGTVTFLNGSAVIGSSALNASGVATLVYSGLSAGTHSITAKYSGNANYSGSTSAVLSQMVRRR